MPGALSALGILMADVVRDYSRTVMMPADPERLAPFFVELEERGAQELGNEGLSGIGVRSADLRYVGQGYELNVPAGTDILDSFHRAHQKRYGYSDTTMPVEVVNVRVRLTAKTGEVDLPCQDLRLGDGAQAVLKTRAIYFTGGWRESNVYQRDLLIPATAFPGQRSSPSTAPPQCFRRNASHVSTSTPISSSR